MQVLFPKGGGNIFNNCFAELNGSHGIISKESENVQMLHCQAINNGQFFGGVELTLVGPGSIMRDCLAVHTLGSRPYMVINQQTGNFSKIKIPVIQLIIEFRIEKMHDWY